MTLPQFGIIDQHDATLAQDQDHSIPNGSLNSDVDAQTIIEEEELMVDKATFAGHVPIVRRIAVRAPRIYYSIVSVLIPFLILIGLSFLFGHFLALVESEGELSENDEALRKTYREYLTYVKDRENIYSTTRNVSSFCMAQYDNNVTLKELRNSKQGLLEGLSNCAENVATTVFPIMDDRFYLLNSKQNMHFDWTTCPRSVEVVSKSDRLLEQIQYVEDFHTAIVANMAKNLANNMSQVEGIELAIKQSDGRAGCVIHTPGGALFWFTIMTTIGYGNAAPATDSGKLLVYIFGFISIIAFAALLTTAGYIICTIFDDFFLARHMKYMTQGCFAILFWLAALLAWMLILAYYAYWFTTTRLGDETSLKASFWFSYITLTTVGLGDTYIAHEEFHTADIFVVAMICLFGFASFNNFAEKLRLALLLWFPTDQTLELILESRRIRHEGETHKPKRPEMPMEDTARFDAEQSAIFHLDLTMRTKPSTRTPLQTLEDSDFLDPSEIHEQRC